MNPLPFHLVLVAFYVIAWYGLASISVKGKVDKQLLEIEQLSDRYLTNWNFFIQTLVFFSYLVLDILSLFGILPSMRKSLQKLVDFVFYSLSAPLSIFISCVFWSIYIYDRELIYPKIVDTIMPSWVNHSLHTMIVVNVILQSFVIKKSTPKLLHCLLSVAVLKAIYVVCVYGTHYEKKLWVYPFVGKFEEPHRFMMLFGLFLFSLFSVVFFYCLNNIFICGTKGEHVGRKQVQKKIK